MTVSKFYLVFYFVYCTISEKTTILKLMSSLNVHFYLALDSFCSTLLWFEIWGSYDGGCENYCMLGCDTFYYGRYV